MISARDAASVAYDRLFQLREQATHFIHRPTVERYAGGSLAPVLLIPGVYETWQFLRPIGDQLNRAGHPVHILTGLGYNRLSIDASAALAQHYLDDNDLREVIIVGHSKGGIIGKHMMVTDDTEGRIDRMFAVNSPFSGTPLARYAPTATLRVFYTRGRMLRQLACNREVNARITSIYSRLDPLLPRGSHLEGATNIELPLVGHFTPLRSRLLFRELDRALHG